MITLALREVVTVSQALAALPSINARAAFDLARIRDALKEEMKRLIEQERELIKEHGGSLNSDGTVGWDDSGGKETYIKAREDFLDKEIEIDEEPVKIEAVLGAVPSKEPEIQPEVLSMLSKIIVK